MDKPQMKILDYRKMFLETLGPLGDIMEAERFFYMLLEAYHGLRRIDLALDRDMEITQADIDKWDAALEKLKQEIPIQYILGKAHFYGLEFEVSPATLIPRPETEELVQWVIADNEFRGSPRILDIGTGSGCIAISLAKNLPDATVFAIDVSAEALKMARTNAGSNGVNVTFVQADILDAQDLEGQFDIIVSNPPYVRQLEKPGIKRNVLEYEPHLALFVSDDDALVFYRKIADLAIGNLPKDGQLYLEINQYLGAEMISLLEGKGFSSVELRKDLYGNDRMVKGIRK